MLSSYWKHKRTKKSRSLKLSQSTEVESFLSLTHFHLLLSYLGYYAMSLVNHFAGKILIKTSTSRRSARVSLDQLKASWQNQSEVNCNINGSISSSLKWLLNPLKSVNALCLVYNYLQKWLVTTFKRSPPSRSSFRNPLLTNSTDNTRAQSRSSC